MASDKLDAVLQTEEDSGVSRPTGAPDGPGLLIVWSGAAPALAAHRLGDEGVVFGRGLAGVDASDTRISRQHARITLRDGAFLVTDLGSRNGTAVGGRTIEREAWVTPPAIVRVGRTVGLLVRDVRRFEGAAMRVEGDVVLGPTLAEAWTRIERVARHGDGLLLTGETGTGKELAAKAFHAATGGRGELVSVNCAAIPAGVAERLLFGTRRGAFSGADRDADGYLVAADHGTIFLDEVAELEPAVQAKLLRALETREVLPLGGSRPQRIELRVVAATLRDLRAEVVAGRFREDLYHRLGRPAVELVPLRTRPEEIAWLVAHTVARVAPDLAIHPSLVELCLGRPWPGNVRELVGEVRRAAHLASEEPDREVRAEHLDPHAGLALARPAEPSAPAFPADEDITRALAAVEGNVTRAARSLGIHRNQLRRYLARKR